MAKFYGGQDHLSVHLGGPTLAQTYTGGYTSDNADITDDTNSVNHISLDTSNDMETLNHFYFDSSDDMDTIKRIHFDTTSDMDTGNDVGLRNLNVSDTENRKSLDILNDVCTDNLVDSNFEKSDANMEFNEINLDSRKSSTAFTIDFGSDSSSGGLSITDKLSRYLPKHVMQRVEQRASNVKVRSDRGKVLDKQVRLLHHSYHSFNAHVCNVR